MSEQCCAPSARTHGDRYRKVLWFALAVNAAMFIVEIAASAWSGSASLAADALDFLGDTGNYAASLAAIALGGAWRSRVALTKGAVMGVYGAAALAYAVWRAWLGSPPEPLTMGVVGFAALVANAGVAVALFAFRNGDANMRSVWLCARNDIIGNLAVLLAAAGVLGTRSVWPDVAVAVVIAALGISAARTVVAAAREELSHHSYSPRYVQRAAQVSCTVTAESPGNRGLNRPHSHTHNLSEVGFSSPGTSFRER